MTKKKLLDDFRLQPARFYRAPGDVLRDRRFSDDERREILKSWRTQAEASLLPDIDDALEELNSNGLHAAE